MYVFFCRLSKAIRLIILNIKLQHTHTRHKWFDTFWCRVDQFFTFWSKADASNGLTKQVLPTFRFVRFTVHFTFFFIILGCGFYWIYLFFNQFPWIWFGNIWFRREIHSKLNSIEFVLKRCKLIKLSFILIVVIWGFNSN